MPVTVSVPLTRLAVHFAENLAEVSADCCAPIVLATCRVTALPDASVTVTVAVYVPAVA